jgi:putative phosphoesterase
MGYEEPVTRIAVIADPHADLQALRDALAQSDRLGCDEIICAGDLVGYGEHSDEVIALIREREIVCVRGNWDRWASGDDAPPDVSDLKLSREFRLFLRNLPRVWRRIIDGVRIVVVHGSSRDEMDGVFPDVITGQQLRRRLDEAQADVLIAGHSHEPFHLTTPGGGMVLNPGALYRRQPNEAETVKVFDTKCDAFVEVAMSSGARQSKRKPNNPPSSVASVKRVGKMSAAMSIPLGI